MIDRHFITFLAFLLTIVSAVHSLTRCPAKGLLRSYYCPRSYDSPDQTRCCSWYGAPSCCLPGGLFCSEQQGGHVRDYCPGPYDGKDNRVCCIKNDKAKCCQVFLSNEAKAGIISAVSILLTLAMAIYLCCCWSKCPLAQRRKRRQMQTADTSYAGSQLHLPQSSQGDDKNAN
ncbi:hypothetical protein ABFA07_002382 [Porites harrisoni]